MFSLAKLKPLDKSGSHSCKRLYKHQRACFGHLPSQQTNHRVERFAKTTKSMLTQSCEKRRSSMHFAIFSAKWETSTANWLTGKLNTQSSCWPFLTSFSIVCGLNAKDSTLVKRMRERDAALAGTPKVCGLHWGSLMAHRGLQLLLNLIRPAGNDCKHGNKQILLSSSLNSVGIQIQKSSCVLGVRICCQNLTGHISKLLQEGILLWPWILVEANKDIWCADLRLLQFVQ